ncbi:Sporulation_stage III [Hexamita inflata]|uniref:Transcriptional regulator SpoIIID n=1 Tax=Hexamita inflata TaxID=28002 RepID=A0AA86TUY0_9EUKA|nr:Sporulation stage III [Hexamita inflata]CAI9922558.1 Sporulation stage III [Hexamita inflata]
MQGKIPVHKLQEIIQYMNANKVSLRQVAEMFNFSKSKLHRDIQKHERYELLRIRTAQQLAEQRKNLYSTNLYEQLNCLLK